MQRWQKRVARLAAAIALMAGCRTTVREFAALNDPAAFVRARAAGLDESLATAVSFEIGIHNSTLAIFLAVGVLGSFQLALPTAVYSVVMYITAPAFGMWLARQRRAAVAA